MLQFAAAELYVAQEPTWPPPQLEVASSVSSRPSLVDNNINNSHQHVHMLVSVVAAAAAFHALGLCSHPIFTCTMMSCNGVDHRLPPLRNPAALDAMVRLASMW